MFYPTRNKSHRVKHNRPRLKAAIILAGLSSLNLACSPPSSEPTQQDLVQQESAQPELTPQGVSVIWQPYSETACAIDGWTINLTPLAVKQAPSSESTILGYLPAYVSNYDSYDFGIEVNIIGYHQGWLKIGNGRDDPDRSELAPRETYTGEGWVPADSIRFKIQSGIGLSNPKDDKSALLSLGDEGLTDLGEIKKTVACSGKWALVEYEMAYLRNPVNDDLKKIPLDERSEHRGKAWFRGVCGNQETTCDGVGF